MRPPKNTHAHLFMLAHEHNSGDTCRTVGAVSMNAVPHMFYARTSVRVGVCSTHPPLPPHTRAEHIILMNRIHFACSPSKSVNVYQRARSSTVELHERIVDVCDPSRAYLWRRGHWAQHVRSNIATYGSK